MVITSLFTCVYSIALVDTCMCFCTYVFAKCTRKGRLCVDVINRLIVLRRAESGETRSIQQRRIDCRVLGSAHRYGLLMLLPIAVTATLSLLLLFSPLLLLL